MSTAAAKPEPVEFVDQLSWAHCRWCGRTTRHKRERYVRPAPWKRLTLRQKLRAWLFDLQRPWKCIECPERERALARRRLEIDGGDFEVVELPW